MSADVKVNDTDKPKEFDPFENNKYLEEEKMKVVAIQWREQMFIQTYLGKQEKITLDNVDYKGKSLSDTEQNEIRIREQLVNTLNAKYISEVMKIKVDDMDKDQIEAKIRELRKDYDQADRDLFCYCALSYFGIGKEAALKYRESIVPYIIGRRYLEDLAIVGNYHQQLQGGLSKDRNHLANFVKTLTKGQYS